MEWILIAGALCLFSHHDICVKQDGPDFKVTGPLSTMVTTSMGSAIFAAEAVSKVRDEDAADAAKRPGGNIQGEGLVPLVLGTPTLGTAPNDVLMNSAPYGMSKEEFGDFIRLQAKDALGQKEWHSGICQMIMGKVTKVWAARDDGCHIEDAYEMFGNRPQ